MGDVITFLTRLQEIITGFPNEGFSSAKLLFMVIKLGGNEWLADQDFLRLGRKW
jgi:hypothetical protein